jgi:DUF1365 family protein
MVTWPGAALYEVRIRHVRRTPIRHEFSYASYQWLVDIDRLPVLPRGLRWLASFDEQPASLRGELEALAAKNGADLAGGTISMLCNARVAGWVFNPLTVYWCRDAEGRPACVIAEVHNTYGQAHRYVMHTDMLGNATTDKQLYVSPFHPVDGEYRLSLPEPGARLDLAITLRRPESRPFTATMRGARRPATLRTVLAMNARHPWSTFAVSARIRRQGIALRVRGLRIHPRPGRADGGIPHTATSEMIDS